MTLTSFITLTLLLILRFVTADSSDDLLTPSKDNSPNCDCYLVSGPDPGYFQYNRFWDFRSIDSQYLPTSVPNFVTSPTADMDPTIPADLTSSYFNTDDWTRDWSIQNFSSSDTATAGKYTQVTTPRNIWVSDDCGQGQGSCLVLRTSREAEKWQSAVEVDCNQRNMWYASVRARLRVVKTSEFASVGGGADNVNVSVGNSTKDVETGAVVGFFTWGSDTAESDVEILTRDPVDHIRYSNQPDYDEKTDESVPGASTDAMLPVGKVWTDWIDHRIDWFDRMSRWYVDGELQLEKTINVPKEVVGLDLNLWGDGGKWSGVMKIGGEVRVQVEWIQMVFNVSGGIQGESGGKNNTRAVEKRHGKKCGVGCSVDGNSIAAGFPEKTFNSSSEGNSLVEGMSSGWGVLLGQLLLLAFVFQML